MSETKLLKTDSPSQDGEPVPKKTNRILRWFSDNRWYLAGTFVVLMMARSEAKRAETPAMKRNRQAIEAMSRVERDRLRHNQQQFARLSRKEVQRVRTIHDAAQKEPQLDQTITQFHTWLATLSLPEREQLLATTNVEDRLQILRRLRARVEPSSPRHESKPILDMAPRNQFANLRIPLHDYERLMRAGAEWVELPTEPASKTSLGQLEYHTSVLASMMDKVLPGWRTAASRTGNRPRPMFPDELRKMLLAQLSDPGMRRAIIGRPTTTQNMMVMTLLARGLYDETRRVAGMLKPTDEELDRDFRDMPENRRKGIGSMPKEIGDRYLQQMWVARRMSPDAGQSLSKLWGLFEKLMHRPPGNQGSGAGINRPRFNGGVFRPAEQQGD